MLFSKLNPLSFYLKPRCHLRKYVHNSACDYDLANHWKFGGVESTSIAG
jgi:hypothetical protein